MTEPTSKLEDPSDKTIVGRSCPRCKAVNAIEKLAQQGYACQQCGFELAYLDYTATGGVRQVLGWVRNVGAIIHDRYQVESVLGRGGFGSTYLVSDLRLNNRRRALKEIPPNMFDDREPMLLSKLDHPGIPDITDRFVSDDLVCLVLEFGGTQTIENKRKEYGDKIPLPLLLPWLGQLCEVLQYLHTRQPPIIHRDLKPANILLDENERIRLIDFGIAKVATPTEATHTLGRAISYGFSSPEQVTGAGTDHRSDIYSLGATAYFLLAGVHPPNLTDRLSDKTLKRLVDLVPGIPPELDQAINQSLELNPEKRQQSVKELGEVFLSLMPSTKLSGTSLKKGEIKSSGRKQTMMAIVAITILVAGAAGAYYYWQKEIGRREAKLTVPVEKVEPPQLPAAAPKEPTETVTVPPAVSSPQTKESLPDAASKEPTETVTVPPPVSSPEAKDGTTVPSTQELPPQSTTEKETTPAAGPLKADTTAPSPEGGTQPATPQSSAETVPPSSHIGEETPPGQVETATSTPATKQPTDSVESKPPATSLTVKSKKKSVSRKTASPKKEETQPPAKKQKPEADWGGAMQWQ